ncbi:orotidine-5'-phosphate decarboxylase [Paucibacter sp. TC2R-5]|uniref:orotidine-5'-phosphate decarboxylase n=1 Tax=Paucibacter sp. TC2R-5 TaxID=2893555 RepID=UPI0021E4676C|nr:orotidine-5'-phosphate decarboxylase [Paucibacter sp. TC2R-5]MCV2358568.1 orotidine-5'-phosphate decarboxylase [Paucibacter sp. TC2R-5]
MSELVIVALDFESSREALALVTELGAAARSYKVGLQLLTEAGPELVRELVSSGKQVFLDLKLHEIPNSVAGAVTAAGKLGVSMVSVHASAGSAVLRAAVEAALPFPGLKIVALTVITSLCDKDLQEIGLEPSVQAQVLRLAHLAADCGCHGVVASAQEAEVLRGVLPSDMLVLTPGVQLKSASSSSSSDQARTADPRAAALAGATHIVVGRAITKALDPRRAFAEAVAQFTHD